MRKAAAAVLAVLGILLFAGCGSSLAIDPRDLTAAEIGGSWRSTSAVGELGSLTLLLERREQSRVYDAVLQSQNAPGLGAAEGYGTLADGHLVLDFGAGERNEYYFEGSLEFAGANVSGIAGRFVFPDQSEVLTVSFQRGAQP